MTTAKAKAAEEQKTEPTPEAVTDPVQEQVQEVAPAGPVPSVGRTVHFQLHGNDAPLAALITAVPDGATEGSPVSLVVYREHLQFFRKQIPFSATPKDNHWSWPPRV
jgi:hypothetical protein